MFNNIKIKINRSSLEYIFITLIFIFFLNFFVPENYEPSGESFNEWAAARMLLDGNGFPVSYMAIGYSIYSAILMSVFQYTSFVIIEFFLTFLFFFVCMFYCLRKIINKYLSVLLCITFMPTIIVLEGHNTIVGCGIFFIYVRNLFEKKNDTFLSITLLLAIMFHNVYVPFFVGHSIGYLLLKKNRQYFTNLIFFRHNAKKILIFFIVILLYLISAIFKSDRDDNNYFMSKDTWAPIKLDSPLEIGVFQIGPQYYSVRNFEKKDLLNSDWFYLSPKIFNNSKSLSEVFFKAPNILLENGLTNLKNLIYLPNTILFQLHKKPIIIISFLILFFSILHSIWWMINKNKYSYLCSFFLGVSATLTALLLTWSHNLRYNIVFFPIFFPLILFSLNNLKLKFINKNYITNFFIFCLILGSTLFQIENNNKFNGNTLNIFKKADGFYKNFELVKNNINRHDVIVTPYQQWTKAFFNINHKNVIPFTELPPFSDKIIANRILNKATQIWINSKMTNPEIPLGHNYHIRYNLHIKEFLKDKIFVEVNVGKLGKIYKIVK